MQGFDYKDIYIEDGKRVLEVNILPEKYCNFDCIFCPIGRSKNKIDTQITFGNVTESLTELEKIIEQTNAELVLINSKGEALIHNQIRNIISFIKNKGLSVRLFSNGYLLGRKDCMEIANMCDEVVGELKVITEETFQKAQRPIQGYTLDQYISNMVNFQKQYNGKFIFEVTIIRGYNDDEVSVQKLKDVIEDISPDKLIVVRLEEEKFQKKLGITDERFAEITNMLQSIAQ
ncbi:radical SAM protein [Anaerotignum sp.]|uniref:radical SAM protein n=1 Tax=Anaerotignum sp. TaxID=2039241 RepID=UPI002714EFEA|nr:radical SAM protein [Anaerotignum sp.]